MPSPSPWRSSITRRTPAIPTHWHARGYGLFAANPLGDKEFDDGNKEFN